MNDEIVVMFDSPEAASLKTVTGWVSRHGCFYGQDETAARLNGCTHRPCGSCGVAVKEYRLLCPACQEKEREDKYAALPEREWDGASFVTEYDGDRYFCDEDAIIEHCYDNECSVSSLMLAHCKPVYGRQFDEDDFCDCLPDDGELPDEIQAALDVCNAAIRAYGPLSWIVGSERLAASDIERLQAEVDKREKEES